MPNRVRVLVKLFSFAILFHQVPLAAQQLTLEEFDKSTLRDQGHFLFQREWKPKDDWTPKGDGLGPMFNAVSCATCHPDGGSADNRNNVQLLTVLDRSDAAKRYPFPKQLTELMPFFRNGGERTVILHKQSTDPEYNQRREALLGIRPPENIRPERLNQWKASLEKRLQKLERTRVIKQFRHHELIVSERNSPALFGLQLIDNISESALQELEDQQNKTDDGISGRRSFALDSSIGKFGWRGQTSSLASFVRGACAAEMGLQSESRLQNQNPVNPNQALQGYDLSEKQMEALIHFVSKIPRPPRPTQLVKQERQYQKGRSVFARTDCAKCHVPDVDNVQGLFSDLLLHDMGPELADPLPALPGVITSTETVFSEGGGYFGGGFFTVIENRRAFKTNILQEWRTPPLWGVSQSAPYLHDGRANTLHEAIMMHGGEADNSRTRYRRLSRESKNALIHFLRQQ